MNEMVCNWSFPGDEAAGWSLMWDPAVVVIFYILIGYALSVIIPKLGGLKSLNELSKRERMGRTFGIIAAVGLIVSCIGKTMCYIVPDSLPMLTKLTSFGVAWMIPAIYAAEIAAAACLFSKKYYKLGVWLSACTTTGAVTVHLPIFSDGPYWASTSGALLMFTFLSALLYAPEMYPVQITKLFGIKSDKIKE